jgi:Transposase DDE domain group 1
VTQGLLPFQYESEAGEAGLTGLAGLPLYLELWRAAGLEQSVARHVAVSGAQGWSDRQMVSALVLLNLAGGEGLDDLDRLEADGGLCRLVRAADGHGRSRRERRAEARRWRGRRSRTLPSPHAAGRWLAGFHDAGEEARREAGRAFIPASSEGVAGLWRVNGDLLQAVQAQRPAAQATLDMDATLIETHKRTALYCYKHFKAYQPLNTWWAEQGLVVHSEFRDGNVPAGHEQLRVLEEAARLLPAGVTKLYLRSDTAAYQQDLLKYCAEGKNGRFGVIEFAISADVTAEFRQAVAQLPEAAWQPLDRIVDGERYATGQQWAEVGYVPNWAGMSKTAPDYRFLAIREPLGELDLGDAEQLPFPTMSFPTLGRYKLFGLVTNRTLPGDELIRWQRERCGKSEEAHAVMKDDLAGGRLPSGLFGANAAWWTIMVLAHNLNAMMKGLALGGDWAARRMKAMRFHLIALPGRVVRHARRLIVRLSAGALDLIRNVRAAILALYPAPSG